MAYLSDFIAGWAWGLRAGQLAQKRIFIAFFEFVVLLFAK